MHISTTHKYLILIIFIGSLIRVADLSGESIWVDEGRAMALAKMSVNDIITQNAQDNHPPLYYIFLHFWIIVFGAGEFSGRFPSVLFGIGAILMIYKITRKLFNETTALYTALIFSLSVFHVQYAQEIKTYAPAAFLTLLSFYTFLHLREKFRPVPVLIYILSTVILLYTHFLAIPVVIAQNSILLADYAGNRNIRYLRNWMLIQIPVLLIFAPWIPFLFQRTADLPGSFWLPPVTLLEIPKTLLIYSGTFTFFGIAATILLSGLIILALFKRGVPHQPFLVLLIWLIVPIAVPLLISFVYAPIYITRITIAASLPFYMLAGYGLGLIPNRPVRFQTLILIVILSIGNLVVYYSETNKERWRETVRIVEQSARENDLILVHAGFCIENAIDFYRTHRDLTIRPFPETHLEISPEDLKTLSSQISAFDRIWLIRSHSRDSTDTIPAVLNQLFRPERLIFLRSRSFNSHKPYTGVELSLWYHDKLYAANKDSEAHH